MLVPEGIQNIGFDLKIFKISFTSRHFRLKTSPDLLYINLRIGGFSFSLNIMQHQETFFWSLEIARKYKANRVTSRKKPKRLARVIRSTSIWMQKHRKNRFVYFVASEIEIVCIVWPLAVAPVVSNLTLLHESNWIKEPKLGRSSSLLKSPFQAIDTNRWTPKPIKFELWIVLICAIWTQSIVCQHMSLLKNDENLMWGLRSFSKSEQTLRWISNKGENEIISIRKNTFRGQVVQPRHSTTHGE